MGKTLLPSDNGKKSKVPPNVEKVANASNSKRKEKPLSSLMPMRKITKRTSTLMTDHMEASTSKASNKRRIVTADQSSKEQQQKNGNEENTEKIPRNFDLNIPNQVHSNVAIMSEPSFSNMASLELTLGMPMHDSSSNVAPMGEVPPYEEAVFSIKTKRLADGIFPGVWITLRPAQYLGCASLPPIIPVPNFRVMEPNVEVDEIRKYVARKLEMPNSSQVEIMLDNDSLTVKKMSISSMMQIWCRIQISTGQGIQTIAGNSGPEFVLPLTYAWKPSSL
ncbi:unnamed protein product [Amaranthus hypochondriacus]